MVEILLKVSSNDRIVSVIDEELDITELFRDSICGNIDGISVVTFNDPVLALEHFIENIQDYTLVISDFKNAKSKWFRTTKEYKKLES